MLEVVFGDSALGSLRLAQSHSKGFYVGGVTAAIVTHGDGTPGTPEEVAEAVRKAEERERKAWEAAVPMDTAPGDSYGFSLALSEGAVPDGEDFWDNRRRVLAAQFAVYPGEAGEGEELWQRGRAATAELFRRIQGGEAARLWYSGFPEEYSGLCWLMAELCRLESPGEIWLVEQPSWEPGEEPNTIVRRCGWGDVEPARWGSYLPLARRANATVCRMLAQEWEETKSAPLRAVISGRLHGVGEEFYDRFILRVLEKVSGEFQQARVIGEVLGRYQLGISDSWVARRMERMIESGALEVVTQPAEGNPVYHRVLRKR